MNDRPSAVLTNVSAGAVASTSDTAPAARYREAGHEVRGVDREADPDGTRAASLRSVDTGTSATPPELLSALGKRYPDARRRVFYGSTEAGPVLMLDEVDKLGADFRGFTLYLALAAALWTPILVGVSALVGHQMFTYFDLFKQLWS